jgi:adenylylsulfate kinase
MSPEHRHRRTAREIVGEGFVEVFVDAPLTVCEARDVKGLYARARRGEIAHFTGISIPFEAPLAADVVIESDRMPVDQAVDRLLAQMATMGRLPG